VFSTTDTIIAIATPPGRGGIGIVRLSGPMAESIARQMLDHSGPLEPRHATLTVVRRGPASDGPGQAIDQVVATYYSAPSSYTGDDVVEVSAHGSPVVLQSIVEEGIRLGARLAAPGEFTLRAYLNGRMDLPQAEAVGDLIDAVTPLQALAAFDQLQGTLTRIIGHIDRSLFDLIARLEASIDFPEEGYHFIEPQELSDAIGSIADRMTALLAEARRGRLLREGFHVVFLGRPNVGKSSLFNALVGVERAIVTEVPGTTRDLITEAVDVRGLRVTLVDTAGLRDGGDAVEREGIARTEGAAAVAEVRLVVLDRSSDLTGEDVRLLETCDAGAIAVGNKSDLPPAWSRADVINVSAVTGEGLEELRGRIATALEVEHGRDRPAITNVRHAALVERARDAAERARAAAVAGAGLSEEFVLADLQEARAALEEITGRRTPDDVLEHVFSRFCVGK
jgi:tRNA modification GTPase